MVHANKINELNNNRFKFRKCRNKVDALANISTKTNNGSRQKNSDIDFNTFASKCLFLEQKLICLENNLKSTHQFCMTISIRKFS